MIREATIDDMNQLAKIHIDTWKTTYKGIIPQEYLESLHYEKSKGMFKKLITDKINYHYVYEMNNLIVGFISFGKETSNTPKLGEIQAIYILENYQRQGIGKKLVNTAMTKLKKEGYSNLLIWALEDNPYKDFYVKLGGIIRDEKIVSFGNVSKKEIAYYYDSLDR